MAVITCLVLFAGCSRLAVDDAGISRLAPYQAGNETLIVVESGDRRWIWYSSEKAAAWNGLEAVLGAVAGWLAAGAL